MARRHGSHDGWPADPRDFVVALLTSRMSRELSVALYRTVSVAARPQSSGDLEGGVATVSGDADLREIRAVLVEAAAEVVSVVNERRYAEAERSVAETGPQEPRPLPDGALSQVQPGKTVLTRAFVVRCGRPVTVADPYLDQMVDHVGANGGRRRFRG